MDTRILKILIAAASVAYTVYLFSKGSIGAGISMIFLSAVLILIQFRSIRLILAFLRLRQQKIEKTKKWLSRVNPDKLWKKQQGYFYFLDGSVALQSNQITEAERSFKRSITLGLRMGHDKAAVKLNLAMIAMAKQRKKEAMMLIAEAKKLDKRGLLKKDIKAVEKAMKKPQRVIRQRR